MSSGPVSAGLRARLIQALERRAAGQDGAVRSLLEDKVAALRVGPPEPAAGAATVERVPSPLAELLAHIERQSVPPAHGTAQHAATPAPAITAAPELKALRTFRDTWSRLNAEQKLKQSRLKLPQNAGPLNSHQLVHRALTLMRDRSPAYLDRFLAHADALLALEQIVGAVAPPPKEQPRAEGERKRAGRGKAG